MKRLLRIAVPLMLLAAGCATGPDYKKPDIDSPASWRSSGVTSNSLADLTISQIYRDPVLIDLIHTALTNNLDVRIAYTRLNEAAAALGVARADYFPGLNASAGYVNRQAGNIPPAPGAQSEQFDLFALLSYELDVWGRVRRLNESARARYLATDEARRAIEISIIAGTASTYFNLRALDRQLEIAEATLATRSNSLELTEIKFDEGNGIVSGLDVAQAETQVASAQSTIATLRRLIRVNENALSVLLGRAPGDIPRGMSLEEQWLPEELPAGLPSDLLLRRPDIRAAEQVLIAANADIGVARAAYFPVISISAALGLQSEDLGDLFDTGLSEAWSINPSIAAPIFNAGKIRSGVKVSEARKETALIEYRKAILQAFREVNDALVSIRHLREQLTADEAVLKAEQKRFELSYMRYEGGVASYSDVLDAQRFLFSAELGRVETLLGLLDQTVQFYKALGGGIPQPEEE